MQSGIAIAAWHCESNTFVISTLQAASSDLSTGEEAFS